MEALAAIVLEPADISLLERAFISLVVDCYDMYFSGLGSLNIVLDEVFRYVERIARIVYCVEKCSLTVFKLPSDKDESFVDRWRRREYYS